jgi:phage recombination protein Bet
VFAITANQHKLSPFKKEIYLVRYGDKYHTIVGIDGMRAKAARSGLAAGKDDAKYDLQADGTYQTAAQLVQGKHYPTSCTVTVYKVIGGIRCPFTKTVLFREYCPANPTNKWQSMPFNMIEKVAEAHALRMAFADEVAGLNIEEEEYAIQDLTIESVKGTEQEEAYLHEDYVSEIIACKTKSELKALYERQKQGFENGTKLAALYHDAIVKHGKNLPE